ncbi:V-type proton ATPase 116 kDa subunit a 1-like isoform X2 [Haliotis rufescens]|uniref:V-type proton ATPase 116 kDa subunit a 1-like isoform X2 n=1 Tax=Haliotis rufescens TaxID=6454 RepID=UPI001EB00DC8|nr:V-type proton ATPase 116 kDa subunit a 1-like isoform X2 [Haliotis rufescens]
MGSLLRSEEMTLCQLFLQSEAAYACVSELGELGLVQFRDLNPDVNAFQRKFVNEIRRCEEMERKLRFLEKEIKKDGIPMLDTGDNPDAPAPREMIDLEATFEKLENEMKEVNANSEALKRNFLELTELKHILRKTQTFFEEAMHDPYLAEENMGLLGEEAHRAGQALRLGFVAGVILRERIPAFERMLWRACRGNVFLRQAEIEAPLEDPVTGDQVYKSVFIIFFQGDQLKSRVKKICEGFRATLYPCPETQAERREMAIGVMTRIEDLNTVLGQTQDHRHRVLVAAAKNIKVWFIKVRKIKAIYHTLNMFNLDVTQKCLIAECWCPVVDLDRIQQALRRGTERSGSSVPSILNRMTTKQEPPTYNRTNKFTSGFQAIVDAYGVASYREINPAPFTIITFPFLFAVMFGDMGHGVIMFSFALWLVLREKQLMARKIDNEIWTTMFGGRYIILLMGAFSIYTGFIYNDVFSKSLNLFGSKWYPQPNPYTVKGEGTLQLNPANTTINGDPYAIGIDPIWQMSSNKIAFTNSFKMKTSVVLGVSQMFFGVTLSLFNHRYFQRPLNIFCEFIPQVVFLFCMFGYLIILIFYKWIYYNSSSHTTPSLLIGAINMFLFNYPSDTPDLYPGQRGFQAFLVVVAVLCIPWMLLVKPFFLRYQHRYGQLKSLTFLNGGQTDDSEVAFVSFPKSPGESTNTSVQFKHQQLSVNSGDLLNHDQEVVHNEVGAGLHHEEEEEKVFDFPEVFINQAIHTIEYCLGCISHTASYLRLWALSLAHAQLSEVLWTMVLRIPLSINGYFGSVMMFFVFMAWSSMTVAVLVVMEGLSAFLHALRLHWVEFQSKFYKGEGYKFQPFSFEHILDYGGDE